MRSRVTRSAVIGLTLLCLSGCAGRSVIVECPPIPKSLTVPCVPEPRSLATNGDLARAYLDAQECVAVSAVQLAAIAELADCRRTEKRVISKSGFLTGQ